MHHSSVPWKITPLYFFRTNVVYVAWRGPIKVQILETFECSDQNSLNSCHFWNKLVFPQILHDSSVSWDITKHSAFFLAEILCTFNKRSLLKYFCTLHFFWIMHFDELLLWKSYKVLVKKVQKSYLSWHWRVMQSLKKNWLVVSNVTWGIWCIFTKPLKSLFIGLFLSKVYKVQTKKVQKYKSSKPQKYIQATKIQRSYLSWNGTVMQNLNKPWPFCFSNDLRNWVNFH